MQATIIALTLLSGTNAYIQKATNNSISGVSNDTAAGNGTIAGAGGNSSSTGPSASKNSGSLASVGIAAGAVGVAALFL